MATSAKYVKSGATIQCDTSIQPRPTVQSAWPLPVFTGTGNSFLNLSLVSIAQTGRAGVQINSIATLNGPAGTWNLYWLAYQGTMPSNPVWNAVAIPTLTVNILLDSVMPSATFIAYLEQVTAGQTYTYAQASLTTPADPTQQTLQTLYAGWLALGNGPTITVAQQTTAWADYQSLLTQKASLAAQVADLPAGTPLGTIVADTATLTSATSALTAYLASCGMTTGPTGASITVVSATWVSTWDAVYNAIDTLDKDVSLAIASSISTISGNVHTLGSGNSLTVSQQVEGWKDYQGLLADITTTQLQAVQVGILTSNADYTAVGSTLLTLQQYLSAIGLATGTAPAIVINASPAQISIIPNAAAGPLASNGWNATWNAVFSAVQTLETDITTAINALSQQLQGNSVNVVPNWDSELGPTTGIPGNMVFDTTTLGAASGYGGSRYVRALNTTGAPAPILLGGSGYTTYIPVTGLIKVNPGDTFNLSAMFKVVTTGSTTSTIGFTAFYSDVNGSPVTCIDETLGISNSAVTGWTPGNVWLAATLLTGVTKAITGSNPIGSPAFMQLCITPLSTFYGAEIWIDNIILARIPSVATTQTPGVIKVGSGLAIAADGTLSTSGSSYTLPVASASVLGGVKQGSGVSIAGDGTISSTAGGVTSVSVTSANGISGTVATSTTTPAITLSLGAITPTSVSTGGLTISAVGSNQINAVQTNQNIVLGPNGTGATYLNYYQGTGGVNFGNGAGANVGSISGTGALTVTTGTFSGTVASNIGGWNITAGGTGAFGGSVAASAFTATGNIASTGGGRTITMQSGGSWGGSVTIQAGTGGWGEGTQILNNAQTSTIGCFGVYGSADTVVYHYIGPSLTTPLFKIDNSGNATVTGGITATAATTSSYILNAADGNGISFWTSGSNYYGIQMSSGGNATYGGRLTTTLNSETTSDYNMYFSMNSGTNRGFAFKANGTVVAHVDAGGNVRNTGTTISHGFQGNGNVGGTGSASWHPSGLYSAGTSWLYGQNYINGTITDANTSFTYVNCSSGIVAGASLRATNYLYCDQQYGSGMVGVYDPYHYRLIYAMGSAYTPSSDGTSLGGMYGLSYTHEDVGGQSKVGLGHQCLFVSGGTTQTAIGSGIWTSGNVSIGGTLNVTGNVSFSGTTSFGTTNTNSITNSSHVSYLSNDGSTTTMGNGTGNIQMNGPAAYFDPSGNLYGPNVNMSGTVTSANFTGVPNYGSYGSMGCSGSSNGWSGISFSASATCLMMNNTEQGVYINNNTWAWYFASGVLNCAGLNVGTISASNMSGTTVTATGSGIAGGLILTDENGHTYRLYISGGNMRIIAVS